MIRRRREAAPVRADGDGFVVTLGPDETALVRRLIGELREILTDETPNSEARALLVRLFPVVHADDPEAEAEYQRLMRDELVQSKLAAFAIVDEILGSPTRIDEGRLMAFMQSVNSIRLVLGTMLGVSDEPDLPEVTPGFEDAPEYHLYVWLSWLLDHIVGALSGTG
jgi:Domain of unknown function (DUF2017)